MVFQVASDCESHKIRSHGFPFKEDAAGIHQDKIDTHHVPQVSDHRHLGVTFSETLSWTRHTDNIVHAASKIGLLRRLRKRLSPLISRQLYLTCMRPSLENAYVAWCALTKRGQERLEKCNRSAARLITRTMPSSQNPTQYLTCSSWYPHTSFKTSSGPGQTCFYSNTRSLTCSPSTHLLLLDCAHAVHPMRWANAIHVSVYHARGKTPNGSRHSTLLFLRGTLFQQNYSDQTSTNSLLLFFTCYIV